MLLELQVELAADRVGRYESENKLKVTEHFYFSVDIDFFLLQ